MTKTLMNEGHIDFFFSNASLVLLVPTKQQKKEKSNGLCRVTRVSALFVGARCRAQQLRVPQRVALAR